MALVCVIALAVVALGYLGSVLRQTGSRGAGSDRTQQVDTGKALYKLDQVFAEGHAQVERITSRGDWHEW